MSRLRLAPHDKLRKVAEAAGFTWVRCGGSHNTFRNAAGQIVTIPDHGAQVIVRPLLRKILRDLGPERRLMFEEWYCRQVAQRRSRVGCSLPRRAHRRRVWCAWPRTQATVRR